MNSAQILATQWYYARSKKRQAEVKQLIHNATVSKEKWGFEDERLALADGSALIYRKLVNEYVV